VSEDNRIPELLLPENTEIIRGLMQRPLKNISDIHLNNLMAFIAINLGFGSEPGAIELVFKQIDQTLTTFPDIKSFAELIEQVIN